MNRFNDILDNIKPLKFINNEVDLMDDCSKSTCLKYHWEYSKYAGREDQWFTRWKPFHIIYQNVDKSWSADYWDGLCSERPMIGVNFKTEIDAMLFCEGENYPA